MFAICGHLQGLQRPPFLVSSCPVNILSHTHMLTHTHTHTLRKIRDLPQPPSSRVKRTHHATVLAQGKVRSLCGPTKAWEPPLSPQCHGNPCWPPPSPRGAFPAGKSSELTAASCHVQAPQNLWGLWALEGVGWDSPPHSYPLPLFTVPFYVQLPRPFTFLKTHFV